MRNICVRALELLTAQQGFAQATVLEVNGSAPRHEGARMLIAADGQITGTVGGGILEAQVCNIAQEVLRKRESTLRDFTLQGDTAVEGMICGGKTRILIDYIDPRDAENLVFYRAMAAVLHTGRRAWFLTCYTNQAGAGLVSRQCLLQADGNLIGMHDCSPALLNGIKQELNGSRRLITVGNWQIVLTPVGGSGTAYIFGAGHCGEKLAPILQMVDFQTVVLDDRAEFANAKRFPSAEQIIVLDSFAKAIDGLPLDNDSYIVIMTHGHLHDCVVLGEALRTNAGYIGMIASREKREQIYCSLRAAGFTEQDLARVHSPVGLAIKAESPAEIAVSITAEMIKVRAELNNGR